MARGNKSNFDNEIKSSMASKGSGNASTSAKTPMGSGSPRGAQATAAASNPQGTEHLQGAAATAGFKGQSAEPATAEKGQLTAASHPSTHAVPNMPNTPTNDPIIHAAGIAHAILRHGGGGGGGFMQQ